MPSIFIESSLRTTSNSEKRYSHLTSFRKFIWIHEYFPLELLERDSQSGIYGNASLRNLLHEAARLGRGSCIFAEFILVLDWLWRGHPLTDTKSTSTASDLH